MGRRRGFSLIELMISVTILLVIMGAAVQFLRKQSNAVAEASRRLDALQNAQYAATEIERELREAGAGVAEEQPVIVQLDSEAITFNANILSSDPQDVGAVYRVPGADTNAVRAMLASEAVPLPNSMPPHRYPDTTYYAARNVTSGAETISYYLVRDPSATTGNTYVLWRRVNAMPPMVVARNIVKSARDTIPFFTYYTQGRLGALTPIPTTSYPLYHDTIHGSPTDVGKSALTDAVRVVRVHFVALTVDPRAKADSMKYSVVEARVRLMNTGLLQISACGAKPVPAGAPAVTQYAPGPGAHAVIVTWKASGDDGGFERDVERYAIFRRAAAATQAGDPIASIPASSSASYSYVDVTPQAGVSYVYGVAAQDCTPRMSDLTLSNPITINP